MIVDDAIKEAILKKIPSNQIKKIAVSRGMRTLRQDGWQKVIAGATTPEEVMKVTSAEKEMGGFVEEEQGPIFYSNILHPEFLTEGDDALASRLDRRVYKRLSSKINIRYRIVKSQETLTKRGLAPEHLSVTSDISAGGLLFPAPEPLALGSIIELKVELPNGESPIECLARVVRSQEAENKPYYNVAACFLDITGAGRAKLNKYVEEELRA